MEETSVGHTVSSGHMVSSSHMMIDLTDGTQRSARARVRELMALEADPGWIAGTLNREGYRPPHDGPWSPEDVLGLMEALGDDLVPANPAPS